MGVQITEVRYCDLCGSEFTKPLTYSRKQWETKRFCSRQCRGFSDRHEVPFCACGCGDRILLPKRKYIKGHRKMTPMKHGYIRVWRPGLPLADANGMIMEHRAVLHDAGIDVPDGFHVHHLNGDPADNRLENLAVLPPREHQLVHARARGFVVNQFGVWPLRS